METSDLPMPPRNIIMTFAQVVLVDAEAKKRIEFQIVPDDQADILNGKYPESAPICQAVIGKVLMERVETVTIDNEPLRAQIFGVGVGTGT
ncbi:GreA/GreB family elongation factor [Nocardia sp. NPDC057353]|uniref:GreA/GreB family elongation factor n=1 Tax=Nocardia sp. NPDC057353 TaxID=3346104 RepID=UPI00362ED2A8